MNSKFKNSLFNVLILFSIFYFLFSIFTTQAATPLVPCGPGVGSDCTFCDLLKLAENVFDFVLYDIVIPLSAVFIAVGGFYIMFAGGSAEKLSKGKKIIEAVIIGIIIIFSAWLLISVLLNIIAKKDEIKNWWNPYSEIKCG